MNEEFEIIKEEDSVTLAEYAKEMDLLDKSRWKWAKRYIHFTTTTKECIQQIYLCKNKMKTPRYQFGEQVPRTIQEAYEIDKINHTNGWKNAIQKEITQLTDTYKCFKILPKGEKPPPDYQYIPLLWAFAVKVDGRKRPRCVAGGHKTPKLDPEFSNITMVSLDTVHLAFLAT